MKLSRNQKRWLVNFREALFIVFLVIAVFVILALGLFLSGMAIIGTTPWGLPLSGLERILSGAGFVVYVLAVMTVLIDFQKNY